MTASGSGRYAFLLALEPGEEYLFDNKPTVSEARRHLPASMRKAYYRVSTGVRALRRVHEASFRVELRDSVGSRIPGDKIAVIRQADGTPAEGPSDRQREKQVEAWKRRKVAEDAPKLPEQLAQAECVEAARRTAGAVRRQIGQVQRAQAPKYDPAQVAVLVTAMLRGEVIQQSYPIAAGMEWRDQPNPTWTEPTAHYRIKPVPPREWYMVVGRDGHVSAVNTTIAGLPHHDPTCRVHVREVPRDEDE